MSTSIIVRIQLSPSSISPDTITPTISVSNSGVHKIKMSQTNNVGATKASPANPSSPGDDFGSTDEVKVFKDEGDKEDEQSSGENLLLEEKSSLIDLTESEDKSDKHSLRQNHSPIYSKDVHHPSSFNVGYLVSPYSYTNGAASMANKIGALPFFCHNGDHLTTPPPAHCGIPAYQIDPKTMGLTRPALYPFPAAQYAYPMLSPEMSAASWHTPSMYSASSGFRSPYPSSLPINSTLSRFSPNSLLPSVHPHHVLNSHATLVTSSGKQESSESNHRFGRSSIEPQHNNKNLSSSIPPDNVKDSLANDKKKPHIKKPLNAFMLYMKEMRAQVVAECTLKESAAINQILGRKWHALGREEQAKYYELARRERQLHMQMYPDWSSRTNASRGKKRKRKQEPNDGGNSMKKCRARYGLDQQNQWCKPCRRKKKCIRYKEAEETRDLENFGSDDNFGSCGSVDDAQTPDDDNESLNQSMSSPSALSGLSSLQSPSTSLASPINIVASPSTPNPNVSLPHDDNQIVTSIVTQIQRNKLHSGWEGKYQNNQKPQNGIFSQEDMNTEKQKQPLHDVHIKKEPSDFQNRDHHQNQRIDQIFYDKLPIVHRNPVGANPRDINNPLSVNQLTRQDFQPYGNGSGLTYYPPFQKSLMTHHHSHPFAQIHAANFANFQFAAAAAAAAAAHQTPNVGKDAGSSNGTHHHNDDGNAISVT